MTSFVHTGTANRVVFGAGSITQLPAEVDRLGRGRVLTVAGTGRPALAASVADLLGPLHAGHFDRVAMHTPVDVTESALRLLRDTGADCVVSLGGGSATGLGKALSVRTGLPQIAVATTYAGSEVTPVLGETDTTGKVTRTDARILPETVIYDVDLTVGLPVPLTVTSGVNAIAHAVEALYAPSANPMADAIAVESITRLAAALPRIVADPADRQARTDALLGAWLAGVCLGAVGMGLHHRLCHLLGGSYGLAHAPTHTVVLPYAMAYNAAAAPQAMRRVAAALGRPDAPSGMYDLIASLGGPTSLRELGLDVDDLPSVARAATDRPYPNPREVTEAGVGQLLRDAWAGARPAGPPDVGWLTDEVVASFAAAPDARVGRLAADLVRHLHHFVASNEVTQDEWQYAIDFLTRTGQLCDDRRQEFVLLSDALGVSSVVDLLANSRTPQTTPSAVLGPFYLPGPPAEALGADIAAGLPGVPLWADVRIVDLTGAPVGGAVVDVWQSNEDGFYDVQLPELAGPVLRARFHADPDGRVYFWSILPSAYPIPDDGPVGQLLAGTGRHPYRAPHLHFMISAPGHRRLVTQLFVAGGAYLNSDAVFGVKQDLVVEFPPGAGTPPHGRAVTDWRTVTYTFRIAPTT
ncbi:MULTISPECIES: maleylacetate reductase and hydroxyquinol 1,2-dioxygenase domain-containing protein [unclassified Solwaraspora]|uniref:maleylacetate reductase and hydroxyquinol 1,2-dioxygenase domain-containing protein n=1 Tax=unclassified Solwaraspora TaxID=2627926 RepID=UPI00259B8D8E|nr:maleylacetate reductase and hydroxyquinol 1,2-dioxygenase domain-containing protein [Solwaraspora sp. WMMA2056]WJK39216.1 maleylacetate reductase and hydroxyquinol 1,2-dioxygenase domain-containing protein [Solwaraspora sp. WMMA2056]